MIRLPLGALTGFALAVLLSGCAGQQAYREGRALVGEGRTLEGLAKLQEAQRQEPDSAEYRIAVVQTRARIVQTLLEDADRNFRAGSVADAERLYREALKVQANNERAGAGLRAIEQRRRVDNWQQEAEAAMARKDFDGARLKLKAILAELPTHEAAVRLMRRLDEQTARPAPETALSAAYRKLITIEFKNAPLSTVFEVISRTSGLNFLFDKDVRGEQRTSLYLKNSTIESAVNLTLLANQLDQRVLDANTVLIYPNTQAKQRDYQTLTVKSFYLSNADAKTVAAALRTILKTRDIVVDEKLNMVILRDSAEAIRLAEKLVALHDVPEPEVMLEVEILEVKRTRLQDLGIRWPDQLSLSPLAATAGGALTLSDLRNINSTRIGATISPLTFNARKVDTDANILANPRIRVRNREKAKILIGERVPNITSTSTSTGFVAESVNYVDVGLKLDVEPVIYPDGEVAIKIALEVSSIINQIQTKAGSIAYQIGTRTAQTVLRLKDGENQVLAGLINDEDRRTGNKLPGLGDIPIAGRLFGSQLDDGSKTEIVLSITPRVLRNVQRPEASAAEFESGTENSLGSRSGGTGAGAILPGIGPGPGGDTLPRPGDIPRVAIGQPQPMAGGVAPEVQANASPASPTAADPATAVAGPAVLRWDGPAQLRFGDSFALQLLVQAGQPVFNVPLAVGFDPRALQVLSVTEGDFLRQGGGQTGFTSRIDSNGQVLLTGSRAGDSGATATGSFATITFRVAAAPGTETRVQLLNAGLTGAGGSAITTVLPQPHLIRLTPAY